MQIPRETFDKYFSCFSEHSVEYMGVKYKTAEHAYHCQRYRDPKIISEIQSAPTARDAWQASQKHKSEQIADFNERKQGVMESILLAKLQQHEEISRALLATGSDDIIKIEPKDSYWGTGPDGQGRNELGKLWMRIRSNLK